jgi:TonB family protein
MSATHWLNNAGAMLLTHLWETTLVLLPLFLLAWLGGGWFRRLPVVWQSRIWYLALLKILVPSAAIAYLVEKAAQLLPGSSAGERLVLASPLPAEVQRVWTIPQELVTMTEAPALPVTAAMWLVAAFWIVGMVMVLVGLLRMAQKARRIARTPRAKTSPDEDARWERLLAECDIPAEKVRLVDQPIGPLAVGYLRPVILIPVSVMRRLSDAELRTILRHEMGHCARRDGLSTLALSLIAAPLFFYPPVGMILKRLGECAEYACDEHALQGADDPQVYLRALAGLVMPRPDPQHMTAALLGTKDSQFHRRLLRLDPSERRPLMLKHRLALGAVLALLMIGTVLPVALADDPPPPPPKSVEKVKPPTKVKPSTKAKPEVEAPPAPPKAAKAAPAKSAPPATSAREAEIHPPRLIEMVPPVYPEEAKKQKIQGTVVVEILVGPKGEVLKVKALSGPEVLIEPSLEAARECTFEPGTRDGKPTKAKLALPIKYSLD